MEVTLLDDDGEKALGQVLRLLRRVAISARKIVEWFPVAGTELIERRACSWIAGVNCSPNGRPISSVKSATDCLFTLANRPIHELSLVVGISL